MEAVLEDCPIGHKNVVVSQDRWSLVTGSVILKLGLLQEISGLSRQVVSHSSGLAKQVSLYTVVLVIQDPSI